MSWRWGALVAVVVAVAALVVAVALVRARRPPKRRPPPSAKRGTPRPVRGETKKLTRAELTARYASGERDFARLTVGGDQLDGVVLDEADLTEAHWSRVNVSGSFKKAKLRSAQLFQCSFDADLTAADFGGATIKGLEILRDCRLKGSSFRGAYLYEPSWGDCDLDGVDFGHAVIMSGDFGRAKLGGARFEGALFAGAVKWPPGFSPESAGLRHLEAEGVDLRGFDFSRRAIGGDDPIKFVRANLEGAKFLGADLVDVSFRGADLRRADFTGANIQHVDLREANLEGAIFTDAIAQPDFGGSNYGTKTSGIDLEARGAILIRKGVDLRGADFTGMTFYYPLTFEEADLRGAVFKSAELKDVNFNYSNLTGADFEGARMFRTIFRCSDLTAINMKGVQGRGPSPEQIVGQKPDRHCTGGEVPY